MVGSKDGAVSCQVVEAVHNDGNDNIEHNEGAEKNERHEVEVRHVGAAGLVRFHLVFKDKYFLWYVKNFNLDECKQR